MYTFKTHKRSLNQRFNDLFLYGLRCSNIFYFRQLLFSFQNSEIVALYRARSNNLVHNRILKKLRIAVNVFLRLLPPSIRRDEVELHRVTASKRVAVAVLRDQGVLARIRIGNMNINISRTVIDEHAPLPDVRRRHRAHINKEIRPAYISGIYGIEIVACRRRPQRILTHRQRSASTSWRTNLHGIRNQMRHERRRQRHIARAAATSATATAAALQRHQIRPAGNRRHPFQNTRENLARDGIQIHIPDNRRSDSAAANHRVVYTRAADGSARIPYRTPYASWSRWSRTARCARRAAHRKPRTEIRVAAANPANRIEIVAVPHHIPLYHVRMAALACHRRNGYPVRRRKAAVLGGIGRRGRRHIVEQSAPRATSATAAARKPVNLCRLYLHD